MVNRPALVGVDEQGGSDEEVVLRRRNPLEFDETDNDVASEDLRGRWILAKLKKHGRLRKCQGTHRLERCHGTPRAGKTSR